MALVIIGNAELSDYVHNNILTVVIDGSSKTVAQYASMSKCEINQMSASTVTIKTLLLKDKTAENFYRELASLGCCIAGVTSRVEQELTNASFTLNDEINAL